MAGSLFFLQLWYFGECAKGCGYYKISKEISLKGIFAKEMIKKLEDENIDKETIEKAIEIGMEVLS